MNIHLKELSMILHKGSIQFQNYECSLNIKTGKIVGTMQFFFQCALISPMLIHFEKQNIYIF